MVHVRLCSGDFCHMWYVFPVYRYRSELKSKENPCANWNAAMGMWLYMSPALPHLLKWTWNAVCGLASNLL